MKTLEPNPKTRHSLLLRLRNSRDNQAWAEFTAVYEPVIYRMSTRRGLQDADAREVVQEVLISVVSAIDRFDLQGDGSFGGWLAKVTRNAAIDKMRKLAGQERGSGKSAVQRQLDAIADAHADADQAVAAEFDQHRRQQLFRWAAATVRERTAEVNWMAFWRTSIEGTPVAEVARQIGVSEGAVYVARCRILKRIRELVHQRWSE